VLSVFVLVPALPFHLLYELTDFRRIWYGYYAIRDCLIHTLFNFPQSVITISEIIEIVAMKQHLISDPQIVDLKNMQLFFR
jgi:hypothetical protein